MHHMIYPVFTKKKIRLARNITTDDNDLGISNQGEKTRAQRRWGQKEQTTNKEGASGVIRSVSQARTNEWSGIVGLSAVGYQHNT